MGISDPPAVFEAISYSGVRPSAIDTETAINSLDIPDIYRRIWHCLSSPERRRLALGKIDNAKFSWYHVRYIKSQEC